MSSAHRVVIVGGGFGSLTAAIGLKGAPAEIARDTLRNEFRHIDPGSANIVLLEGTGRILPAYPTDLSEKARRSLEHLGVEVRTGATVTRVDGKEVRFTNQGREVRLPARTVLWAAGVKASPLGRALANGAGAALDGAGRVRVAPDLSIPGHPEILVLGDLATCQGPPARRGARRHAAGPLRRRPHQGQTSGASHGTLPLP